jgi:hypothetical protein
MVTAPALKVPGPIRLKVVPVLIVTVPVISRVTEEPRVRLPHAFDPAWITREGIELGYVVKSPPGITTSSPEFGGEPVSQLPPSPQRPLF